MEQGSPLTRSFLYHRIFGNRFGLRAYKVHPRSAPLDVTDCNG